VDKQARNNIMSGGVQRRFILVAPEDLVPGTEELPVVILWHHLGSDPDTFLKDGYLQTGINSERFLAILPESKGDLTFWIPQVEPEWPWMAEVTEARIAEEMRFFDDMLACVAEQYGVNPYCITNGGVSAGGMWNAIVVARRSELLSSTITVSGGVNGPSWGGDMGRPWEGAARQLPVLMIWGGDADSCITVDFQASSMALEAELAAAGHSIIECIHNCGHGVPPFEDGDGLLSAAPLWQYFLNHPHWLTAGNSPYKWDGIPDSFPEWCGVGAGSATRRTGACNEPACPI
jgi:predicted esterase